MQSYKGDYPVVPRSEIIKDLEDGMVRFHPPLLDQKADWEDRSTAGKNVGKYFTWLFAAAYGGTPADNDGGGFVPDVVKPTVFGDILTEVKGVSTGSKPMTSPAQLRGYGNELLIRVEDEGQETPIVDYAIFRYGKGDTRTANLSGRQLMARLPRLGRDLLIAPQNLVYALALIAPFKRMNHQSSQSSRNKEDYRIIYGTDISSLHRDPCKTLDYVRAKLGRQDLGDLTVDDFLLDDLTATTEDFPRNLRCWGHNVRSFPVLKFDLENPRGWLAKLRDKGECFFATLRGETLDDVPF